ncbi:RNA-binding (RRM/RBD/RNP motifs) family protein [Raphanus sativus]|uniref:Uncharacterized protein LOC108825700 n=1 Tax=Raphanus sativus TaxID=3726 RepID=A0A6J0L4N1_RAPSA|nr:uncharacterized protein LOC108825700 [Raphanus sativus]KAJ4874389.1 RNA-binding (RRM/RBD/RNP motifs) family protein [Raphanus sativus]
MDESVIKGVEGLELNGSDAAIRKSSRISRMSVEGYDTSSPREDVEEALRKHFASREIKLIHASAPQVDDDRLTILCRYALIYLNEEDEEKALKFDGSDMGGRILRVAVYPFDSNHLEHFFAPTKAQDKYLERTLFVTGFDPSLTKDDTRVMVRRLFGSSCAVLRKGRVLVNLRGQDAIDKALQLSGDSVGGFTIVVNDIRPIKKPRRDGVSRATISAMVERYNAAKAEKDKAIPCEGNQETIMTTD